jgi:hypothetical protein
MPRHALGHVEVTPPAGWHDASVLSFVAPADGGFRANVIVTTELVKDASVDAFAERQNAELFAALPKYKRQSTSATVISGMKAVRVAYTFAGQDGELVRQDVVYVLRGQQAYTLVMTTEERDHARVSPAFDAVLASFNLG